MQHNQQALQAFAHTLAKGIKTKADLKRVCQTTTEALTLMDNAYP